MESISLPISNASLSISSGRDGNQDQEPRSPGTIEEWLNELESEFGKLVPWTCPNRLKVILSRIAYKVHKEKPTIGKMCARYQLFYLRRTYL